jgi:hypothetical protein
MNHLVEMRWTLPVEIAIEPLHYACQGSVQKWIQFSECGSSHSGSDTVLATGKSALKLWIRHGAGQVLELSAMKETYE